MKFKRKLRELVRVDGCQRVSKEILELLVVVFKSGVDHIGVEQGDVGLSKVGGDGLVQEFRHAALAVDSSVSRRLLDHGLDGSFVVCVYDRLEIFDICGGVLEI